MVFSRPTCTEAFGSSDWDVGGLIVNDLPIYRLDNMPSGGWKVSGLSRVGTVYAMGEMTGIKHLVIS